MQQFSELIIHVVLLMLAVYSLNFIDLLHKILRKRWDVFVQILFKIFVWWVHLQPEDYLFQHNPEHLLLIRAALFLVRKLGVHQLSVYFCVNFDRTLQFFCFFISFKLCFFQLWIIKFGLFDVIAFPWYIWHLLVFSVNNDLFWNFLSLKIRWQSLKYFQRLLVNILFWI